MSRASFSKLKGHAAPSAQQPARPAEPPAMIGGPPQTSRYGRKAISGYFAPELSTALHILARKQDRNLQALMAEAFNDLLRKYGEHPQGDM